MKIYHLRVNQMDCPFIDSNPEFSWRIKSEEKNVKQKAYCISVSTDGKEVWTSGKIESDDQCFIEYGGKLKSKTVYNWSVMVWDNHGNSAHAESVFETAFLDKSDWKAEWVESAVERNEAKWFTYGIENPVVLFSRKFSIGKNIKSARLYASCYGCYRVSINGKRPDDREFAPEFTPYGKILNYQTYDISDLLEENNNIEFLVGDGWFFCAQTAVSTSEEHKAPAIIYQLEVKYDDGTKEEIRSDGSEIVRTTNIIFSDLFMGEKFDLTATYGEEKSVIVKNYDKSVLKAQPMPPIFPEEIIPAKKVYTSPKDEMIVDFGQVIAGRTRIKISAPKGTEITFEYTEVTDKYGNYFSTLDSIRQCDTVISDGETFIYEPSFTFHGFRYIRVKGLENADITDFIAVLLTTHKENAGSFTCDDERFNRLYKNIRYSQKNNMMSIPTDCPSREKAGWTGDILIYAETALLNENMTPFLTSWLEGLKADQLDNGVIPLVSPLTKLYNLVAVQNMAPFGDKELTGIAGWSDAIIWVPYAMYKITGNRRILSDCFESMQKWCEYIIRTAYEKRGSDLPADIDKYLWNTGFHFGEWLVPGRPSEGFEVCKETAYYIAPFFGCYSMKMMAEICDILGKDSSSWTEMHRNMKNAIIKGLFEENRMPDNLIGAYILAFAFDLVSAEYYEEYKSRLENLIEKNGRCLGTGFLATPFMLSSLDKIGRHDLAKDVLFNNKQPSWLFEVEHGATAIWENWMALDEENNPAKTSFDHYAFGCVDSYICHNVCGINGDAGYKHIVIEPQYDSGFEQFTRVFICNAGSIKVQRNENSLIVSIPENTTAKVIWNGKETEIGSGTYKF